MTERAGGMPLVGPMLWKCYCGESHAVSGDAGDNYGGDRVAEHRAEHKKATARVRKAERNGEPPTPDFQMTESTIDLGDAGSTVDA